MGTVAGLHFALATTNNIDFACELIGPEMLTTAVIKQTDLGTGHQRDPDGALICIRSIPHEAPEDKKVI